LQYSCPDCQAPMEDIRSGRELKIDRKRQLEEYL
ncbi:MAG: hydrogenase maturation nickel metallochaperone HypA, partial [Cyanobacteria bacterium J06558_2]